MSPQATPTGVPAPAAASGLGRAADVVPFARGVVILERRVLSRLAVSTLSYLSGHPGATATQIRDGLGVGHLSQVGRVLGRLREQGLVASQSQRHQAWALSASGLDVLNQAQPVWTPATMQTGGRRASGEASDLSARRVEVAG